jgi:hypothetical protein
VPSKDFANWVAPFGASLPSAYFEGSPESAILSRTNLFRMTLWKKISSKFQNPSFYKQHVQIVSAKGSRIRQRNGMYARRRKSSRNPASQFSLLT